MGQLSVILYAYDAMLGNRGGVLPYISHICMCCRKGYGFSVCKRVETLPILVWNRVSLSRELRERMNVFVV